MGWVSIHLDKLTHIRSWKKSHIIGEIWILFSNMMLREIWYSTKHDNSKSLFYFFSSIPYLFSQMITLLISPQLFSSRYSQPSALNSSLNLSNEVIEALTWCHEAQDLCLYHNTRLILLHVPQGVLVGLCLALIRNVEETWFTWIEAMNFVCQCGRCTVTEINGSFCWNGQTRVASLACSLEISHQPTKAG